MSLPKIETGRPKITLSHLSKSLAGFTLAMILAHIGMASAQTGGAIERVFLEEPVQDETHSGVGNLRGWALASQGVDKISIWIDGEFALDAPYGSQRTDVGGAFPDVPGSLNSGYSLAYNYSSLSAGPHVFEVRASLNDGSEISTQASFNVVRFESEFISDPNQIDIDNAQCDINGQQINFIDALIAGTPTD